MTISDINKRIKIGLAAILATAVIGSSAVLGCGDDKKSSAEEEFSVPEGRCLCVESYEIECPECLGYPEYQSRIEEKLAGKMKACAEKEEYYRNFGDNKIEIDIEYGASQHSVIALAYDHGNCNSEEANYKLSEKKDASEE